MAIRDIIVNRKEGKLAPSVIEKRKQMLLARRSKAQSLKSGIKSDIGDVEIQPVVSQSNRFSVHHEDEDDDEGSNRRD